MGVVLPTIGALSSILMIPMCLFETYSKHFLHLFNIFNHKCCRHTILSFWKQEQGNKLSLTVSRTFLVNSKSFFRTKHDYALMQSPWWYTEGKQLQGTLFVKLVQPTSPQGIEKAIKMMTFLTLHRPGRTGQEYSMWLWMTATPDICGKYIYYMQSVWCMALSRWRKTKRNYL